MSDPMKLGPLASDYVEILCATDPLLSRLIEADEKIANLSQRLYQTESWLAECATAAGNTSAYFPNTVPTMVRAAILRGAEWRPVTETEPPRGVVVLGWCEGEPWPYRVRRDLSGSTWDGGYMAPTHWCPLPPAARSTP